MRNKRRFRNERKHHVSRIVVIAAAVALVAVCSIVGVMANTVPCTVIDGEDSYSFNILGPGTADILAKAQEEGMEPVSQRDRVVRNEEDGTVRVYRAMDVSVNTDGEFTNIVAYYGDTVEKALRENGIEYPEEAELTPSGDTVITSDMAVSITTGRDIQVTADGKTTKLKLQGGTVEDALKAAGISLGKNDKVSPEAGARVTSGMTIKVARGYGIRIMDGAQERSAVVFSDTVEKALKEAKVSLSKEDKVSPALSEKIKEGTQITVTRVELKEKTETEEIPYETVYEDTSDLYEGETQIKVSGVPGEKAVLYRETYENGTLTGKTVVSETVAKEPVSEVILRGTFVEEASSVDDSGTEDSGTEGSGSESAEWEGTGDNTFVDYNGNVVSYSNVLSGSATAYCIPGGTTSIGLPVSVGIVAVNPDIIPYGTELYIASDDYVYGYAIAGDTGGALLSGEALVDVYYDTLEECYNFGRRDMKVYILS